MGITDYIPQKWLSPAYAGYRFGKWAKGKIGDPTAQPGADEQRANLNNQGGMSSVFADQAQQGFGALGAEASQQRDALRRIAEGKDSLSAEQLRQGLQQNMASQRSMAASASPANGPMAALAAMQNNARSAAGASGAAAMAGIAERNAANQSLQNAILQQRQQEMQVALGSRGNAINAYGGVTPGKSMLEQYAPYVNAGVGLASLAASDRRLKEDISDGKSDAAKAIDGLRSYTFKYKDEKHGKGKRLGIMAQDLEKAGLKHAVVDTPAGKMVHGAHLATANTAMIAELGKRLSKVEGKKKK